MDAVWKFGMVKGHTHMHTCTHAHTSYLVSVVYVRHVVLYLEKTANLKLSTPKLTSYFPEKRRLILQYLQLVSQNTVSACATGVRAPFCNSAQRLNWSKEGTQIKRCVEQNKSENDFWPSDEINECFVSELMILPI